MGKNPEQLLQAVVAILKETRLRQGLSHETLAARAGVTRPMISFIESGRSKPSLLMCFKLANALDISLAKIIISAEKNMRP